MIHPKALAPLLMATVENSGATLTIGFVGQGDLGMPERVTDIWTVGEKSHSGLDAEDICKPSFSEELSYLLLTPSSSRLPLVVSNVY